MKSACNMIHGGTSAPNPVWARIHDVGCSVGGRENVCSTNRRRKSDRRESGIYGYREHGVYQPTFFFNSQMYTYNLLHSFTFRENDRPPQQSSRAYHRCVTVRETFTFSFLFAHSLIRSFSFSLSLHPDFLART